MRQVVHVLGGAILITAAVYLGYRLVVDQAYVLLAFLAPVIIGAAAFGAMLILRVALYP